jgi:hypothetical protein
MMFAAAVANAADAAVTFNALLGKYVKGDYFDYASLSRSEEDKQRFNDYMAGQAPHRFGHDEETALVRVRRSARTSHLSSAAFRA